VWLYFSIPVLFIILGLLVWVISANPVVKECGRLTVQAGLIGLVFALSGHYFPRMR
jgi:predicted RND superfamily exporter protein